MTSTKPRTERVPNTFAGPGAVRQSGGNLPVYRCTTCKGEVAWAKSNRTGRRYLVNVRRGYMDQRFYQGNDLHGDCAEKMAAAEDDLKRRARFSQAQEGWHTEIKRLADSGAPKSEILQAIEDMGKELEGLRT